MKNRIQNRPPLRWKTKLLLWLYFAVMLFSSPTTYAQLVNGDFESSCGGNAIEAFQGSTRCVTGSWFVSHGSPDITYGVYTNTSASAYMWARALEGDPWGEGLFIQCPDFEEGVTYRLRFRYFAVTGLDEFIVTLANGLVHRPTYDPIHPLGYTNQVLYHNTSLTYSDWIDVDFFFTPTSNFAQLWFYPLESDEARADIWIDDVVITRCVPNVVYTSFSGTPALTEVSEFIRASGTSAVTASQTITYRAGDYIQLLPDFRANPGTGYFHAYIAPCTGLEDIQPCDDNDIEELPKRSNSQGLNLPLENSVANYPNPATGKTTISYTLAESGPVTLMLTNLLGEKVLEFIQSTYYLAGHYSMELDASKLAPGMYFLTLQSGTTSTVQKMVVTP